MHRAWSLQRVHRLALVMILLILKMLTHCEACRSAGNATYCCTCERCTHGSSDYSSAGSSHARTEQGSLFARGERCTRATC
jgi:hypothetical protein